MPLIGAIIIAPVALAQQEDLSLQDALVQLAANSRAASATTATDTGASSSIAPARFTGSVSQWDDSWIGSLFCSVGVAERVKMTVEVDSEGYLAVGAGYEFSFSRSYAEPFFTYGRSDLLDIYLLGVFGARLLTPNTTGYATLGHEWRRTNAFPVLAPELFDQTELRLSVGLNHKFNPDFDVDIALNNYHLLSGNRGINEVENDNIFSASATANFTVGVTEPFIRMTVGKHRVRPGDPVITESSVELGARFAF